MTPEKMLEVVQIYRALLLHIPPADGPYDQVPTPRGALAHVHGMLNKIEDFIAEADPKAWDKANRWLGFLQGVLWMQGLYTLNQMRDHNRTTPPVTEAKGFGAMMPEDWIGKTPREILKSRE